MSHYCGVAEARGKMPCGHQCDECRDYERAEASEESELHYEGCTRNLPYGECNCKNKGQTMNETQRAEFEALARPLIKWLNENCHPHVTAMIETTGAQLYEGVISTGQILDYVKD